MRPAVTRTSIVSRSQAPATREILRHWQEAVPNDRLAHLVKHAARGLARALQMRLTEHAVSYGHWTFLRVLWESEGLTQRQLSDQAGVMEPTTFSALNAMEKLGYVMRRPNPNSRSGDSTRRSLFTVSKSASAASEDTSAGASTFCDGCGIFRPTASANFSSGYHRCEK